MVSDETTGGSNHLGSSGFRHRFRLEYGARDPRSKRWYARRGCEPEQAGESVIRDGTTVCLPGFDGGQLVCPSDGDAQAGYMA